MTDVRRRTMLRGVAGLVTAPTIAGRVDGSEAFRPIGRETIDGAKEVVVDPDGATAYVATSDGFATVSLDDPTQPEVLAQRRGLRSDREDGPMESIWDVKLDGDRLIVAGPANPTNTVSGFLLYDVSDPSNPRELAFHETTYPIHNAYLVDDTAYLTAGEPIVVVDVSGEPEEVGSWSVIDANDEWDGVRSGLRSPHDLWVSDGVAYVACWDAGTWIVDVTDPGSPTALGQVGGLPHEELAELSSSEASSEGLQPPGNHHFVQPTADGSLLAVGMESWGTAEGAGGPSGIDLWDVSDPESPRKLSEIEPPRAADESRQGTWTTAHNFDLVGDTLVSSWYQGGVKLHDVADPSEPEEIAWWREPDEAAFWAAVHATDEFFVASSTNYPAPGATEGLYVFPNRPGEQPDPPALTETATTTSEGTDGTHRTDKNGSRTTETATGDRNSSPNGSLPTGTATSVTPGQPGFGFLAAAAGTTAAAYWRSRRGTGPDDEQSD